MFSGFTSLPQFRITEVFNDQCLLYMKTGYNIRKLFSHILCTMEPNYNNSYHRP